MTFTECKWCYCTRFWCYNNVLEIGLKKYVFNVWKNFLYILNENYICKHTTAREHLTAIMQLLIFVNFFYVAYFVYQFIFFPGYAFLLQLCTQFNFDFWKKAFFLLFNKKHVCYNVIRVNLNSIIKLMIVLHR